MRAILKYIFGVIAAFISVIFLVALITPTKTLDQKDAGAIEESLPPATKYEAPKPVHYYIYHHNNEFGYARETSEQDKINGTLSHPLFLITYNGKQNGRYNFVHMEGYVPNIASCDATCNVIDIMSEMGHDVIQVTPGSISYAIASNMKNGFLDEAIKSDRPKIDPESLNKLPPSALPGSSEPRTAQPRTAD